MYLCLVGMRLRLLRSSLIHKLVFGNLTEPSDVCCDDRVHLLSAVQHHFALPYNMYVLDVNKTRHHRHNPVLHLSLLVSASVSLSALPRSTVRTDGCRWKTGCNDQALALPVGPFGIARRSPDRRRRCHMRTAPPIARGTHDPLS